MWHLADHQLDEFLSNGGCGFTQPDRRKKKPEHLTTASSVLVTLMKVKGSWLIAKFDPL